MSLERGWVNRQISSVLEDPQVPKGLKVRPVNKAQEGHPVSKVRKDREGWLDKLDPPVFKAGPVRPARLVLRVRRGLLVLPARKAGRGYKVIQDPWDQLGLKAFRVKTGVTVLGESQAPWGQPVLKGFQVILVKTALWGSEVRLDLKARWAQLDPQARPECPVQWVPRDRKASVDFQGTMRSRVSLNPCSLKDSL